MTPSLRTATLSTAMHTFQQLCLCCRTLLIRLGQRPQAVETGIERQDLAVSGPLHWAQTIWVLWGGWNSQGQPAERNGSWLRERQKQGTKQGSQDSVSLSHFLSWVTRDAPITYQYTLFSGKAVLSGILLPITSRDLSLIVLQPKPTYSCYIQYAYFKLTKEFSTAISSGESMSMLCATVMLTFLG